jgi:hypothetical protein
MKTTVELAMKLARISASFVVLSFGALAQGGAGGAGPGAQGARLFDPTTVATFKGEVAAVAQMGPAGMGLHLQLKTADGTMAVHLGPAWYLQAKGVAVAVGDAVEIVGSRITFDGQPALIAQSIVKGSQTLALRDAQGFPMWAGRGGRAR